MNSKIINDSWKGIADTPVLECACKARCTVAEATRIIMKANNFPKCHILPLRARENVSLLLDMNVFDTEDDVKADLNGVYRNILRTGTWTVMVGQVENAPEFFVNDHPESQHITQNPGKFNTRQASFLKARMFLTLKLMRLALPALAFWLLGSRKVPVWISTYLPQLQLQA